ncbi:MAG: c-type cytochrome [Phenylobacterium sp.]|uniref:c-type cytochrome n=1 Tax=Phenylobacterium sp. TaxID=1871053 RepID=UPI00391B4290
MSVGLVRAAVLGAVLTLAAAGGAEAGAAEGEALFKRHCAVCHSATPDEVISGPSLARLVGRKAGSARGYPYSPAMKAAGLTWSPAALDAFLAAPRKAVPKTTMAFIGLPNPAQRADLVAYLATLK